MHFAALHRQILFLGFAEVFVHEVDIPHLDCVFVKDLLGRVAHADELELTIVDLDGLFVVAWHLEDGGLAVDVADYILEVIVVSDEFLLPRA